MADLYTAVGPLLRLLPPETAHRATLWALARGLAPPAPPRAWPELGTRVFGLDFPNPVGLAAGFDKSAEVVDALLAQGFGFVEVGAVTPRPQPGNPKPRLFRLDEDEAVINRLGFNNDGMEAAALRLEARLGARGGRPASLELQRGEAGRIGANLGVNAESSNPAADFVACLRRLHGLVDYFTLNVSSPNTPGLTGLQGREALSHVLSEVLSCREALAREGGRKTPVLVKIAPDLSARELADVVEVALERRADGLVVGNTTRLGREGLKSPHRNESGGLSGKPLFAPSTRLLGETHRLTEGRLPLIGVGGISSGADAYAKIRSGASLVQLYTALVFKGPRLVERIKSDLAALLARDGFERLAEAVGADLKSEGL